MNMKLDYKDEDMEMDEHEHEHGHGHEMHDKKHKLMTMEDVSRELEKDFSDEISDSKKYFCMAKIADKAGCEEDCHYLMEMSKDEYTHAHFIYEFMKEHDIHVPEEQEKEFMELKERMEKFFQ